MCLIECVSRHTVGTSQNQRWISPECYQKFIFNLADFVSQSPFHYMLIQRPPPPPPSTDFTPTLEVLLQHLVSKCQVMCYCPPPPPPRRLIPRYPTTRPQHVLSPTSLTPDPSPGSLRFGSQTVRLSTTRDLIS